MKNMRTMRFTRTALKNLFSPPVTRPYPEQPREYPERTRGHVEIDIDTCILCGLCSRKCPTGAITVNRAEKTLEDRALRLYPVRLLRGNLPEEVPDYEKYLYPARGGEDRGFLPENQYARSGREACGSCSKNAGGSGGESGGIRCGHKSAGSCRKDGSMRAQITVLGVVQGVGFRPFVAECARTLSLRGSVCNSGGVVRIEAYGTKEAMEELVHRLRSCAPPAARVDRVIVEKEREAGAEPEDFLIVESEAENGADLPLIPPDLPICADCLAELGNPENRRFQPAFLVCCTACGPRYSILEAIPYDREHISMREYAMCPECGREYRQPGGRRQHAQTISCRDCGPQLILSGREDSSSGSAGMASGLTSDAALSEAVRILKEAGFWR